MVNLTEKIIIRKAKNDDIARTLEIYNYEVTNGVVTLDLNQRTLEEWKQWYELHNIDNHPLIVAEADGEVVGYASLSPYRNKEAYKTTVELSVYIDINYRKNGIAAKLIEELIEYSKNRDDIHTIVSVITVGNEASVKLHKKYGFVYCGTIKEAGIKFGRYLDIENYQLVI